MVQRQKRLREEERSQRRQSQDKNAPTDRQRHQEEKGENSFSKSARRREPAVFI